MDCRRCGAPLHEGVVICPECGSRQRRRLASIRCASCGKSVTVGLQVCPHCGRNVRPAGPRWGLWLAGVVALALFSLWALDRLPVERVVSEVIAFRDRVSGLVQVLGPVVSSPSLIPSEAESTPALVALLPESPTPEPSPIPTATPVPPTPAPEPTGTPEEPLAVETPVEEASATPTVMPGTEAPAPALRATETPTLAPTATPTSTSRPTLPPPTATPPSSGGRITYRVQQGDTLSTIAARYGITWQELAAANGLNAQTVLRIGQELIIPLPGAALPPTATPTSRLRPTATPALPTATPLSQLAPPVVKDPGDGASYSGGDALIELSWQPVSGMGPEDQYRVVVTWVEQGAPMEHRWLTTATGTRVPPWLWGKADQPARKYTWTVQVVRVTTDGKGREVVIPLSPPSPPRVFYWG